MGLIVQSGGVRARDMDSRLTSACRCSHPERLATCLPNKGCQISTSVFQYNGTNARTLHLDEILSTNNTGGPGDISF
jgi:hypothetical protein